MYSMLPASRFGLIVNTSKEIFSIEVWSDAFLVYMSIYLEKHPKEARYMLKYASVIRQFAQKIKGLGWKSYDENLRKRIERGTPPPGA